MNHKKVTGYLAICQCKKTVGAIDADRSKMKDQGKIIGKWLQQGCTVKPVFSDSFSAVLSSCVCSGQWVPIEGNEHQYNQAAKKNCKVKFDNGEVLNHFQEWPIAEVTHFFAE